MNFTPPKYDIGQTVYLASASFRETKRTCPDCLGSRRWTAKSPAGGEYGIDCPTCKGGYMSYGVITEHECTGEVRTMTVGCHRYDDDGWRYMCVETGVGSGYLWEEHRLFPTKEEADAALPYKIAEAEKQHAETVRRNDEIKAKNRDDSASMVGYYKREISRRRKEIERFTERIAVLKEEAATCS